MKKNKFYLISIFFIILLSIHLIKAEITISEPKKSIYNFLDSEDISIIIKDSSKQQKPFSLDLVCENGDKNLMQIPSLWIKKGEEKITYSMLFSKYFLDDLKGNCKFLASYGNEKKESNTFILTDEINITLNIKETQINPGSNLKIEGTALPLNGKTASLNIEIYFEGTKKETQTINNKFSSIINIPNDIKSGNYKINIYAYQKENDIVENEGEEQIIITINQVPTSLEIVTDKDSYLPNEEISLYSIVLDQALDLVEGKTNIEIYDSYNNLKYSKEVLLGEKNYIAVHYNDIPGKWKIKAKSFNLTKEKIITIKELERARFNLENSVLKITNIGNIPYNESLKVTIGNYTEVIDVFLDIDESKEYKLEAPDGEYNIVIEDAYENFIVNNVPLTGAAINIEEIKEYLYDWKSYIFVWIFLIALIIALLFVIFKKNKLSYGSKINEEKYGIEKIRPSLIKEEKNEISKRNTKNFPEHIDKNFIKIHSVNAQYEVELKGKEENVSVLSLKFENLQKYLISNKDVIETIVNSIKESKGSIYQNNNYIIGIYSFLNTRTFENEKIAIKTAEKIYSLIKEHNKKFKEKINVGIAIHTGKMILRKEEKLKFLPIGNTLSLSKKLSDISLNKNNLILLSEEIYKKLMSIIKAEKINVEGIIAYSLEKSLVRESNEKFIQDFLRRNKF
ncbi:MAG: hypothetical protein QW117_03130 [Candidatus Pacearchaeota archaeon]